MDATLATFSAGAVYRGDDRNVVSLVYDVEEARRG